MDAPVAPAKPRYRVKAGSRPVNPVAAYFKGEQNPFLASWQPYLREHRVDVAESWQKAAGRAVEAIQNSGFITGVVEVASGSTVGDGLKFSARPARELLGWDEEFAKEWAKEVESRFLDWKEAPHECDASETLTFDQMQQVAFASYLAYGEVLSLTPMIRPRGRRTTTMTKLKLLPPARLSNQTAVNLDIYQGVMVDEWGAPRGYRLRSSIHDAIGAYEDIDAYDRSGRPNILHVFEPGMAVTRGISPLSPVLKVYRQVDQYADATLTSALIQNIFAATMRTKVDPIAAFDGLMTYRDTDEDGGEGEEVTGLEAFAANKGTWYNGAEIDFSEHGRIAHLMPNDELTFTKAEAPGQSYDEFMGWLLREICRGAGVTYESGTGDYRGATYSSVRMAGAVEWLTVLRRRKNICKPFAQQGYMLWLDEEIGSGRMSYPGGYRKFREQRAAACRAKWAGPPRPQADEFKTARAYEVRKDMQATTLAEIAEEYGDDWAEQARQRARENALHAELGLPLPWAVKDTLETEEGLDLALKDEADSDPGDKPERKRRTKRKPGIRNPGDNPDDSRSSDELDAALESELLQE